MEYRIERDSMGEVRVPADRYWGAQTQRSHENFPIGVGIETMPAEIIRAFAVLKKAAAIANRELLPERMSAEKCALIGRVCDEILAGELDGHFPLVVWQTGSGTQSNMNVNEVIANRGNELAGKKLLHPNDDVNMSQSSNDTFPTAMHIAACLAVEDRLLPAVSTLEQTLLHLEAENADVLKTRESSRAEERICRTRRPSPSRRRSPAGGRASHGTVSCSPPRCPPCGSWRSAARRSARDSTPPMALTGRSPQPSRS